MWEVGDSNIEGQGILATRNIQTGETIGHAYGLIGEVNGKHIAGEITILGLMHNHSETPNATPIIKDRKIYFIAKKTITKSTEITCDYNEYKDILNIENPASEWQEK